MNLELRQKITLTLCILWIPFVIFSYVSGAKSGLGYYTAGALILLLPPLALLWLTGTLYPLLRWYKGTK